MSDIGFAKNYMNLFMINITPGTGVKTWARVGAGINSASWNGNETVSQDNYYDGDGMASSEVDGGQLIGSFAGHRKYGDPAQDFIAGKQLDYAGRHTDFRWIAPNGDTIEGDATIVNIVGQGGDPNSKSDFSFEAHYNGMPSFTKGNTAEFPETVTVAELSVAVGATAQAGVTVTPEKASKSVVYGIEDDSVATVDANGNVTGIKAGKTKLSVKSAVRPMVNTEIEVTVTAAAK